VAQEGDGCSGEGAEVIAVYVALGLVVYIACIAGMCALFGINNLGNNQ
jgi:hypothetical protein